MEETPVILMASPVVLMAVAFVAGVLLGRWLEVRRWRRNADAIQRIESGGRLFKVNHDD